jgi:hypothetical protein
MTNQADQAELRYSFCERVFDPLPTDAHQPPKLRGRKIADTEKSCQVVYPPPIQVPTTIDGLFHCGLSLFSNSFGFLPASLDGTIVRGIGTRGAREDMISLRKNLEAEILRQ